MNSTTTTLGNRVKDNLKLKADVATPSSKVSKVREAAIGL